MRDPEGEGKRRDRASRAAVVASVPLLWAFQAAAEERGPTFLPAAGVFDGRLNPDRPPTSAPPGLRGGMESLNGLGHLLQFP